MSKIFLKTLFLANFAVFLILTISVIRSGIYYQYDNDELSHVQLIYLLAKGYVPYKTVWMFFTPVFHYLFVPLYNLLGFSFRTIFINRIIMTALFLIRVAAGSFTVGKAFGKKAAIFFIPLILLDPFSVFSGMQIRPDNLMMLLFTAGLAVLMLDIDQPSEARAFPAGLLLGLSALTLLKILPPVAGVSIIYGVYTVTAKKKKILAVFFSGLVLPWILFVLYTLGAGTLTLMAGDIFTDARVASNSLLHPGSFLFYFRPDNVFVFGLPGKPLNWLYTLILPVLAFCGIAVTFSDLGKQKSRLLNRSNLKKIILAAVFVISVLSLITFPSVFLQYFLPVSWLLAAFAAVFISRVLEKSEILLKNKQLPLLILLPVFYLFSFVSIKANYNRATMDNKTTIRQFSDIWRAIPEGKDVFPNFLFRPLIYPVYYGAFIGDLPKSILKKFPPIDSVLEERKVPFLLLDSYSLMYLDWKTRQYIDSHYHKDVSGMLVRN